MTNPTEIEVFFDGGCPLCRREIALLKRWDRAGRILFTDINSPNFLPLAVGKSRDHLMAEIHGRLPDGNWVQGVEVFRRVYAAVGLHRLARWSRWPVVSHMLDWGYAIFARNRLRLTGRCADRCAVTPMNATQGELRNVG